MGFTEFACRSGGSNLNAGTRTGNSTEPGTTASFTYAAGGWVNATLVFTPVAANPLTDGVAVGDFAALDTGGATAAFIARVTARDATTITLSSTAKSGTNPATGTYTLRIGGAWAGPTGTTAFPFGFVAGTMTNAAGDFVRVNFKNDATYSVTAAMTHSVNGPTIFQGYTTSYGDLGRATIDGGTSGASYIVLTVSGLYCRPVDLIFNHNGASGSSRIFNITGLGGIVERCVFCNGLGSGMLVNGALVKVVECEAYANNSSNTSNFGGFENLGAQTIYIGCIAHDNTGSNTAGFYSSSYATYHNCIAETNGGFGFNAATATAILTNCDAYNNGSHGLGGITGSLYVSNSNFIKNGGYGISVSSTGFGCLLNCGFGSGTQANTSGTTTNTGGFEIVGTVTYASNVTPWVDPANGDFRINLATAKGTGRGTFTQTQAGYTGTVGYPDVGSSQHADAGGLLINRGMDGGMT